MKKLLTFFLFLNVSVSVAQLGIGTVTPASSSILDITSKTKGVLVPRMLDTERTAITTPATGLLVYQTNGTAGFYYYNGTVWVYIGSSGGTTETASNGLTKTGVDIQLGGDLTANTTITQDTAESLTVNNNGTANTIINLKSTGDLDIQDNGTSALFVNDSGNIGLGSVTPVTKLDINGALTLGNAYAGTTANAAPTNGLRVEGKVVVNKANSEDSRDIFSAHTAATAYNNVTGYVNVNSSRAIAGYASSNGIGVFGHANRSGFGVVGNTQQGTISSFIQGGEGVLGQADGATGGSIPIGVHGIIDETITGMRVATPVIGENNNITRGNGFSGGAYALTNQQAVAGVYGNIGTRGAATGDNGYMFGVVGDIVVVSGTVPDGSGGVLGAFPNSTSIGPWGALGYKGLTSTFYSVYGGTSAGSISATNTGNRMEAENQVTNHIGLGINGAFMGGFVKGKQYGLMAAGKEFGLYVQGKTITNEPVVNVIDSQNEKALFYGTVSQTVDVTTRGKAKLVDGKCKITFNQNFKNSIVSNDDLNITVTPNGRTNGVFVYNITKDGFEVEENNNGLSNCDFHWTAIGTRKGYENGMALSKTIMSKDFEKNMQGVMNDDGTLEEGTPIYFDGNEVKFERMPEKYAQGVKKAPPVKN